MSERYYLRRPDARGTGELPAATAARCARCASPTIRGRPRPAVELLCSRIHRERTGNRDASTPQRCRRRKDRPFRLLPPEHRDTLVATDGGRVAAGERRLREALTPPASPRTWRAVGVRIVTSSSAAVGCTAMVASKSALVAFILTAMPSTWIISAGVRPDDVAADARGRSCRRRPASSGRACRGPTSSPSSAGNRSCRYRRALNCAARLRLRQADGADLGLGEHRGRHIGMIDLRSAACRTPCRRRHGPRGSRPASG